MLIQQAMALPAGRGQEAQARLAAFVAEMKATGFVADALTRHRVEGAIVAPAS
jgi:polar amino acid transport system substrate-binding protein